MLTGIEGKTACNAAKDWGQQEKGMTEDKMVGCHHWLSGHESEQAPGDGEGQGGLVYCSPWGHKKSDMTEEMNNSNTIETSPLPSSHVQFPDTVVLKQSLWTYGSELEFWVGLSWAALSSLQDSTFTCSESVSGLTGAGWSKINSLTCPGP